MKKLSRLSVFIFLLMLMFVIQGCSKTDVKLLAAQAIADALLTGQDFNEPFNIKKEKMIELLAFDNEDIADSAMVMDISRITPECIVVITASSQKAAERIKQSLKEYQQSLKAQYINYRPDEVYKIDEALIRSKGLQQVLVISPQQGKAEESLNAIWK